MADTADSPAAPTEESNVSDPILIAQDEDLLVANPLQEQEQEQEHGYQLFTVDTLIDFVKNKKNEVSDGDSQMKNIELSAFLQAQTRRGQTPVSILGKRAEWEKTKQLIVKDEFSVLCNTKMHCGHLLLDFATGNCCWKSRNCDKNGDKTFYKYFEQYYDEELDKDTDSTNISFGHRCELVVELMRRKAKSSNTDCLHKFLQIAARRGRWDIVQQMISLQHDSLSDSLCNTLMHCGHLLLDFASARCCDAAKNFNSDAACIESRCDLVKNLMEQKAKSGLEDVECSKLIQELRQKLETHKQSANPVQSGESNEQDQEIKPNSSTAQNSQTGIHRRIFNDWNEIESNAVDFINDAKFCSDLKDIIKHASSHLDYLNKFRELSESYRKKITAEDGQNKILATHQSHDGMCSCCTTSADPVQALINCAANNRSWSLFKKLFEKVRANKPSQSQNSTQEQSSQQTQNESQSKSQAKKQTQCQSKFTHQQLEKWLFDAVSQARVDAADLIIDEMKKQNEKSLSKISSEVKKFAKSRDWIGVCYLLQKLFEFENNSTKLYSEFEHKIQKLELKQLLYQAQECCSYEAVRQILLILFKCGIRSREDSEQHRVSYYKLPFVISLQLRNFKSCNLLLHHHKINHVDLLKQNLPALTVAVVKELADCHTFDAGSRQQAKDIIWLLWEWRQEVSTQLGGMSKILINLHKFGNNYLLVQICNKVFAKDSIEDDKNVVTEQLETFLNEDPNFALQAAVFSNCEQVMKVLLKGLVKMKATREKLIDSIITEERTTLFQLCAQNQDLQEIFDDLILLYKRIRNNEKQSEGKNDSDSIESFELDKSLSKSLTCIHFACTTGNTKNIDLLYDKFQFYRSQMDNCNADTHCLELAHANDKLDAALKAECLNKIQENRNEKMVRVCMIIDKIEKAFELPDESKAQTRIRLTDYSDSADFLQQVVDNNDSDLFKCGLRMKVWDPRDKTITEMKIRDQKTGELCNPIELALRNDKTTTVCIDLIRCSQFDLIPTCLQTLLQLRDYKAQIYSEDYHYLKNVCLAIVCKSLNFLCKESSKDERQLLFRYIMGEIDGGPRFPASLINRSYSNPGEEFSIYELIQLTDCSQPLATKCMEHLVDRIWKHNGPDVFNLKNTDAESDEKSNEYTREKNNKSSDRQQSKNKKPATNGLISFIKQNKTPQFNFFSHAILHFVFLIVFGIHLILMSTTVSLFDYILAVYGFDFMIREIYDFVTQIMPPHVYLIKKWPQKPTHKLWMWLIPKYFTDLWNFFDLLSIGFLVVGLVFRFQLTAASNANDLMMSRIFLSVSFFFFSFHSISLMRYFKPLGPTISMIKSQLFRDLIPFTVIFVTFSTGFGFFLFGLFYQGQYMANSIDTDFLLRVFTVPYLLAFGEFSSDSWDTCQFDNAASDQTIWGKSCPQQSVTRFYTSFVITAFVIAANIVLFNLLIAKFSLTVSQKEMRARQIWRKSRVLMLKGYKRRFYLPAPFFIFGLIAELICTLIKYMMEEFGIRSCCKSNRVNINIDGDGANDKTKNYFKWWRSSDVNDYPDQYIKFLLFQAKKTCNNRGGLSFDFKYDEEEIDERDEIRELACTVDQLKHEQNLYMLKIGQIVMAKKCDSQCRCVGNNNGNENGSGKESSNSRGKESSNSRGKESSNSRGKESSDSSEKKESSNSSGNPQEEIAKLLNNLLKENGELKSEIERLKSLSAPPQSNKIHAQTKLPPHSSTIPAASDTQQRPVIRERDQKF